MDVMITNNQLTGCFEIAQGGHTAILEYIVAGGQITLVHTEVPEELEGKGFGGKLVKYALDYAKQNNLKVIAHCEFAQSYIKRHEN